VKWYEHPACVLYGTSKMLSGQPWDGRTKLHYTLNCDYRKTLGFSFVLNTLLNQLSSKCTVSLQLLVSGNLH
jgi:hypothetical protein